MKRIDEMMKGVSSAVIMGHIKPDGDCVGSCLGLGNYLWANYPQVQTEVYLEPFSEGLSFLKEGKVINPKREESQEKRHYDIAFVLDCADEGRIGAGKEYLKYADQIVCMDHHISNTGFGDIVIILPDYSSACEVVYSRMEKEKVTYDAAMCLYVGMAHDTGIFQYSNVSPLTMERAGELLSFGFDFSDIIMTSYYEKSIGHQRMLGLCLQKSQLTLDGNGIWSYASLADFEQTGCTQMETEGIVEALRNTKGIDYSVFFYEYEPESYRVSFRSKGKTNVSLVACAFGGGGHVRASGCSFMHKTPEEIIRLVTEQVAKQA